MNMKSCPTSDSVISSCKFVRGSFYRFLCFSPTISQQRKSWKINFHFSLLIHFFSSSQQHKGFAIYSMVRFINLKGYCWLLFTLSWWQKQNFIRENSRLWHPNWKHYKCWAGRNWFWEKCRRLHVGKEQRWRHSALWRKSMHANAFELQRCHEEVQQTAEHFLQGFRDGQESFGTKCNRSDKWIN